MEAVVASAQGRSHPFLVDSETQNNSNSSNGDGDGGSGFSFENADARIPSAVVEQGVRAIKDVLREVVILEDDGEGTGSGGNGGSNIAVEVGGNGTASTTGSKRQGDKSLNGDTSPTKKGDKKTKQGKQAK